MGFDGTKESENKKVNTESIKCESCGSNMVFDPDSQMLYCEHCGSKKSFDEYGKAQELSLISAFDENNWDKEKVSVFKCENCGAQVVLDKNETAKICPFCGTAHVEKIEELSGLKPNGLIPFSFSIEDCLKKVKLWATKKWFAPKRFKKGMSCENVNGVYMPCFTFDSKTTSIYHGRIGETHTRVVGSGKDRRTETYIVWRNISGTFFDSFDDVLISAGSKIDQKKLNKISPFDTNNSKGFNENYMLGFMSYHYDKDIDSCWNQAKTTMDSIIKKDILSQYSYDHVDYINVSTSHEEVTYKYVMLPVYVGNFKYTKKNYGFYVNGESGKICGKTPVSIWKVLLATFMGLCAVALIGAIVYFVQK